MINLTLHKRELVLGLHQPHLSACGFVVAFLTTLLSDSATAVALDTLEYNRDIRPLLAHHCFACHGPDKGARKADLQLDAREAAVAAGAISETNPADSELLSRIFSDDPDVVMPPPDSKKPLSDEAKSMLKKWVLEGAKYEEHWAFVSPVRKRPKLKNKAWREGPIDPYVMDRLLHEGLRPNSEADRRVLIRRVTFDLTGLPPSLEEIHAFLNDNSSDAYKKLVDRLMNNPAYGEHMARYWADLVRLADTNGMHKDFYRNFSTYRSWLIRAFNSNLPYDDFVRYQVAGDLYEKPTEDQYIASGFNRLHLIIDRGTALPEESQHKNVLDRVEAFGTAFLGLTVQCAQCHEHKYDPISQKEFYGLYAFFNNFDGAPETVGAPKGGIQQPSVKLTSGQVAMVMKDRDKPKPTFLLIRGAYDDPGEEVQRGTPEFLPALKTADESPTRMVLAEWLVDPAHPLTARVAVNRFWQQFFGVGLVKTSEDFGVRGEWPSHREMLDELTLTFIESGWDVKNLVREIVLSRTYRQSSNANPNNHRRDPENRLLARGPSFRLDAEMIRDQLLFVSGQLNTKMFGESVKPPQPPGLWKAVSMAAPFVYVADKGDSIYRRSFYTYWRRAMPPPQMTILNAPSREFCTTRRERTNTPLQALLLMNEQEYFKAARACASRTLREAGGDQKKTLVRLAERITSHRPEGEQLGLLQETLAEFRDLYREDKTLTEQATPESKDASFEERVNLAAWTLLTHSLLNLEATKVKR